MDEEVSMDQSFLDKLHKAIEDNLGNEHFGVDELAHEVGISRSQLHRKLHTLMGKSASQMIREFRLEKALEMLQNNVATASEISYRVGFSSPSYFNTSFNEYFGYPPGKVKEIFPEDDKEENVVMSQQFPGDDNTITIIGKKSFRNKAFLISAIILLVISLTWLFYYFFIINGFYPNGLSKHDKELSIVVLPFKNLSDNPSNQYFADGIREDILNDLYWITALRVVSRTSAEQFREGNLSTREIARKMNVKYVLEGSVRRYEGKVRISVQLIDAYRDEHLWSSRYDKEWNDIIDIQGEIAKQVASKLKAVLPENEIRKIEKKYTQNPKAYEYYLQGRFLHHKANSDQRSGFDKEGVLNCLKYYEMAIAEDENFAKAYAGLANANFNLSAWGFIQSNEGFLKARSLCLKALEIDPDCAEAHATLGAFFIWGQRNFEEGGKSLRTSIQLNPNFATAHQMYAQYLMITGPIKDARFHVNRALELEPYFWVIQNLDAYIYYFEGKNKKAINSSFLAQDLKPDFIENDWLFFLNYAKLGEGEKSLQALQAILKHHPETEQYSAEMNNAYNKSGINGLFEWLIDINKNKPITVQGMNGHPFYIAWWNTILGNREEAIYWLQKNVEHPRPLYHYFNLIATNPDFEFLRDDPRFLKIVDEIGLTPYLNQKSK